MALLDGQVTAGSVSNIVTNQSNASSAVNSFSSDTISVLPSLLISNSNLSETISKLNCHALFNSYFQDYLSSFARFFGELSRQDATKIYIDKASLPRLTPQANNTAESLFAALLLRGELFESNPLLSKIIVTKEREYLEQKDKAIWRHTFYSCLIYLEVATSPGGQIIDVELTPDTIDYF